MSAVFSIHFDGPIVTEHKVSLRVMSKTYEHMQRAIDRAASYFALKRSESEAANWGRKTSSLSLMSESALTLCLVFMYAGWFGDLIDYSVGAVLFVFAILALARSFIVFLKHYLPHTMHIKGLLGQGSEVKLP